MKKIKLFQKYLKRSSEILLFLFVLAVFIFSLYKILTIAKLMNPLAYGVTADTKLIEAKALDDHDCDETEWHFVINQIESEALAPASIHVVWANSDEQDISQSAFTGKVAHYNSTANLNSTVVGAYTYIYVDWDGQFNLSHGPCPPTPTPTPWPTLPPCPSPCPPPPCPTPPCPSPSPSPSPRPTPTPTPPSEVTPTPTPTVTPTPTPPPEETPTPTPTPTPVTEPTSTPTPSPGASPTPTPGVGGPPPEPTGEVLGVAEGEVLGVSTLAGTGSFADELFQILFIIGCVCASAGLKLLIPAKRLA